MIFLDFEKPISDLLEQLEKTRQIAEKNNVDVSKTVAELEQKIEETKKSIYSNLSPWQRVQLSRHPDRPYALSYINAVSDNTFIEMHGDRTVKDDKAMVGGFGSIDGQTVMFIAQQKGINTKMRQYRNFGMANPEGYRKALRLMKLAEKFNKPIVTFIDTPGAYPGLEAEERGQGEAIARNLYEMMLLKVPVICIVIGEGASGGALGIGIGDKVLMLENTWYSVISPESCSSILWRSWDFKERAAEVLKLTADDMLENKLIDGIIKEPLGGAHSQVDEMHQITKAEIKKHLAKLTPMNAEKNKPIAPGTYRHYKGKLYEVIGEGRHSETLEELVFYKALYISAQFPETFLWVRPKAMFLEEVIVDGKMVPRFQLIS
jgi:acetyl-CoA carboxylase carboxyl transferase subunit alpha